MNATNVRAALYRILATLEENTFIDRPNTPVQVEINKLASDINEHVKKMEIKRHIEYLKEPR